MTRYRNSQERGHGIYFTSLFPAAYGSPSVPGSMEQSIGKKWIKKLHKKTPYKWVFLAKTHPIAHGGKLWHCLHLDVSGSWGPSSRTRKGVEKVETEIWVGSQSPNNITNNIPSISPNSSFVVAFSSEGKIIKMKCSECPTHPHGILLFTVLGRAIYFVS